MRRAIEAHLDLVVQITHKFTQMEKGKLIVFEGTDGSGKGTQFNLFMQECERREIPFVTVDFPDYSTPFGQLIGRMLKGEFGDPVNLSPYAFSPLYSLDRMLKKDALNEALADGKLILANRYETANEIFQSVKFATPAEQRGFIEWLRQLEFASIGLPAPDLVIYLHVPVEVSQELIAKKTAREYIEKGAKDKHEADIEYQRAVQRKAEELCATEKNWRKIDCLDADGSLLSREAIAARVWDAAAPFVHQEINV